MSLDALFHCLHTARALRCSANGRKRKNSLAGTSLMLTLPTDRTGALIIAEDVMPRLVTPLTMSMGFSVSVFAGLAVENAPRNFRTPFWMGASAVRWILRDRS